MRILATDEEEVVGGWERGRLVDLHATSWATQGGANRCRRLRGNFGGDFGRPPRSSLARSHCRLQFRKRGISRLDENPRTAAAVLVLPRIPSD